VERVNSIVIYFVRTFVNDTMYPHPAQFKKNIHFILPQQLLQEMDIQFKPEQSKFFSRFRPE
jgi:hypothetical protein